MPTIISILSTFEIIGAATAYTLGLISYNWINVFMNTFIKPFLSKYFDKDISKLSISIFDTSLKIGPMLLVSIDFILVLFFILFLLKFVLGDIVQKIIDDKDEHEERLIRYLENNKKYNL